MTILQKASDRDGFIYEVIKCILINDGPMDIKRLQRTLISCGVYVKKDLLTEIVKTMNEKGLVGKPEPKTLQVPAKPKIIIP